MNGDDKAGEQSPADAEPLDPAYESLEEQRADIAARARHFAKLEAEFQRRAEAIEAEIGRQFRGADAAEIHCLAERYAAMAAVQPFPIQPRGEPRNKPTPTQVRKQIEDLCKAIASSIAQRTKVRRSEYPAPVQRALSKMSPESLFLVLPFERETTVASAGACSQRQRGGLAVWAKTQADGADVPKIGLATLLAGAEDALNRMGDVRAKPGPKPAIDPVAIALTLSHDLSRLSGRPENRAVEGRYDNRVSDVLSVVFGEIGITESPIEVARRAAQIDPTRKRRQPRRPLADTNSK